MRNHSNRPGAFLAVLFLASVFSTLTQQATASNAVPMTANEQRASAELFQLANEDRARHNLQPLRQDAMLLMAAWRHAQPMVRAGVLSHQLPGEPNLVVRIQRAGVRCSTVAENLADAPTASQINDEWMHSPPHRANLLDPRLNAAGIAVIQAHGEFFAVQDFARTVATLTPSQQERQVASLLRADGLQLTGSPSLVRGFCGNAEPRARPMPRAVMQFSTADLTRLPLQVEQGIRAGKYRRAVIGACSPGEQNGFAAYRMVVLLY